MDWNENATHRKHLDWISCPLPLRRWWQRRCTFLHRWCLLQRPWACYHLDWSCSLPSSLPSIAKWTCCKWHFSKVYYLSSPPLVRLIASPSFNHWMAGVGLPLAWQTSWILSFSRTPISRGSSDPEMLGGTNRELLSLEQACQYRDKHNAAGTYVHIYLVWWGGSSCALCPPHWKQHTCKCHCLKPGNVRSAVFHLLRRCASPETLNSLKRDSHSSSQS